VLALLGHDADGAAAAAVPEASAASSDDARLEQLGHGIGKAGAAIRTSEKLVAAGRALTPAERTIILVCRRRGTHNKCMSSQELADSLDPTGRHGAAVNKNKFEKNVEMRKLFADAPHRLPLHCLTVKDADDRAHILSAAKTPFCPGKSWLRIKASVLVSELVRVATELLPAFKELAVDASELEMLASFTSVCRPPCRSPTFTTSSFRLCWSR